MKTTKILGLLVILLSLVATLWPVLITNPQAQRESVIAVTGEEVELLGYGPYRHMPKDMAVQGFAQDWITLGLGIPLLIMALFVLNIQKPRNRIFAIGITGYFLVQYTMYLTMAAYNELFLVWTGLVGFGFHLFLVLIVPLINGTLSVQYPDKRKFLGWFLVGNGFLMALLWFSIILGPLFDGTFYPKELEHLTTLIVQGLDLAIFLPPSILAGIWYLRGRSAGWWLAPAYGVFLIMQMIALGAKITGMSLQGVSAGPALVIIPLLGLGAFIGTAFGLRGLGQDKSRATDHQV